MKKFKALVHFIIHEFPGLNLTQLNKSLWVCDMMMFVKTANGITDQVYRKVDGNTVPDDIHKVINELVEDGDIQVMEDRYTSLQEPDVYVLSDDEKSLVLSMSKFVCEHADDIVNVTYEQILEAAGKGEEIPLCAILAIGNKDVLTPEMYKWVEEMISEIEGYQAHDLQDKRDAYH